MISPPVLIVDDDPANRLVLEADDDVVQARSGREALDHAAGMDFAVLLLDVRMPILDGYETAAELRRLERTRLPPILFASAHDQTPSHVPRGFSAGATDVLFAPLEPEVLRFKVRPTRSRTRGTRRCAARSISSGRSTRAPSSSRSAGWSG